MDARRLHRRGRLFVISGYLISSIILNDYEQSSFSFIKFLQRRTRRIMPALLAMLVTTAAIGYFMVYRPEISELGKQGLAALLSYSNIYLWQPAGDYWGPQVESSAFLHTWSLSVEEQFYLVFPFGFIFLLTYFRKHLALIVGALVAISATLFIYGSFHHANATFFLLPTRVTAA